MSTPEQVPAGATVGARLAVLRERRGLTQRELAERAGITPAFLSGVENDKRNVSSEVLLRLADVLNASLDYLLRGEGGEAGDRQPVQIAVALAEAAEKHHWPFAVTLALQQAYVAVVGRRGGAPGANGRQWTAEDWVRLHEQFYGRG